MRDGDLFWLGLATTGTAVELWAIATKRDHLTLSRTARRVLHIHTRAGRAFTTVAIGAGASWLANHLLTVNPEENPS